MANVILEFDGKNQRLFLIPNGLINSVAPHKDIQDVRVGNVALCNFFCPEASPTSRED